MASNQDFPVILYEKDQEIPTTISCQFVAEYQDNFLPGHYLKIEKISSTKARITADGEENDDNTKLKYTFFNDDDDKHLFILSDSSGQFSLAYEGKENSKPVIFVKNINVTNTTSIKDAKAQGIVFVMTEVGPSGNPNVKTVCLQPWSSNKSKTQNTHFLAFNDDGQVIDPSSNGLGKNEPRCQFSFWKNHS